MTRRHADQAIALFVAALVAFLVYGLLTMPDITQLHTDDWRCTVRDVESGQCDVYERKERYRGDDSTQPE